MPAIFRRRISVNLDEHEASLVQRAVALSGVPSATLAHDALLAAARRLVQTAGLDPDTLDPGAAA